MSLLLSRGVRDAVRKLKRQLRRAISDLQAPGATWRSELRNPPQLSVVRLADAGQSHPPSQSESTHVLARLQHRHGSISQERTVQH